MDAAVAAGGVAAVGEPGPVRLLHQVGESRIMFFTDEVTGGAPAEGRAVWLVSPGRALEVRTFPPGTPGTGACSIGCRAAREAADLREVAVHLVALEHHVLFGRLVGEAGREEEAVDAEPCKERRGARPRRGGPR